MTEAKETRLSGLFSGEGGTTEVFSAKTADYVASRPAYPQALFDALRQQCGLTGSASIADIGAGSGLLTTGLLRQGWQVVAVEPNAEMRAAADRQLAHTSGYRSVPGTAERTLLAASSVDLITAAQAFHWFEIDAARAECLRILKPAGQVALIWNDRLTTDPLHQAMDEIFAEFGGARRGALLAHEERKDVPRFFGGAPLFEATWPYEHRLDADGLVSLALSRSYMPARNSAAGTAVVERVSRLFARFSEDSRVVVRYTTVLLLGRPAGEPRASG